MALQYLYHSYVSCEKIDERAVSNYPTPATKRMAKSLEDLIESNPDPRELKRALAVKMTLKGYRHQEIISVLQVSSGFISKWKQEFVLSGIKGLKLKHQGSRGYLSQLEKEQVLRRD